MAHISFMLLALAQTTALKVFGTPGRGPAIQRVYPSDNSVKVEYWLGAGQLTTCTVDDVRGLQKCVKVVSAAVSPVHKSNCRGTSSRHFCTPSTRRLIDSVAVRFSDRATWLARPRRAENDFAGTGLTG